MIVTNPSIGKPAATPATSERSAGPSRPDLSEWASDATVAFLALWTLSCHISVAFSSSLILAIALCCLSIVGTLLVLFLSGRAPNRRQSTQCTIPAASFGRHQPTNSAIVSGFGFGIGILVVFAITRSLILLWCGVVCLLTAAFWLVSGDKLHGSAPKTNRADNFLLWAMAVACVLLALIAHRSDIDDVFYVNIAAAVADIPGRQLFGSDTMHGIENLPLHFPIYKVQSFELLNAAVSYVTGIPAIYCFHWVAAALAALLVPLAHAKLFRRLAPRHWLWAVAIVVIVLVAVGDTHRWYGNFALVRIWQGKSVFLTVLLPLIYSYGLDYNLRPGPRTWLLLCAAQIAAVGCTVTALWLAPLAACGALMCGVGPSWVRIRVLLSGLLSSGYVVIVGLMFRIQMEGYFQNSETAETGLEIIRNSFSLVVGDGRVLLISTASILLVWTVTRKIAQRFAVVVPLLAFLTVLNPMTASFFVQHVIGPPTYWRSLWAIPIPVLVALLLAAPLQFDRSNRMRVFGKILCAAMVAGFVLFVPRHSTLHRKNGTSFSLPRLKVPAKEYAWANAITATLPSGSYAAAPSCIGNWLPTFHRQVYPLEVRNYLRDSGDLLGGTEDFDERRFVTRFVSRPNIFARANKRFDLDLNRYDLNGVCIRNTDEATIARTILRRKGFRRSIRDADFELWIRQRTSVPGRRP